MIWNEKCRNCVHGLWVRSSTVHTMKANSPFPSPLENQDWKKHWYFLTLTRLHSTTVSEWNFVLDSALERAWKITWVEWWECRKLSFVLFLFYSLQESFWREKSEVHYKNKAHINWIVHASFTWYQCVLKLFKALHAMHKCTTLTCQYSCKIFSRKKSNRDTVQKQHTNKLNRSRPFYLLSIRSKKIDSSEFH